MAIDKGGRPKRKKGKAGGKKMTKAVMIARADRRARLLKLKIQGYSDSEIADFEGVSRPRISELIRQEVDKLVALGNSRGQELMAIDNARHEEISSMLFGVIMNLDGKQSPMDRGFAVDRFLRVSDAIAKRYGWGEAQKVDLSVTVKSGDGGDPRAELMARMSQMAKNIEEAKRTIEGSAIEIAPPESPALESPEEQPMAVEGITIDPVKKPIAIPLEDDDDDEVQGRSYAG